MPLWSKPATELAAAVRTGEVSALDVVDDHLARIAEVNPYLNAVTQLLADRARAAARETDRRRARARNWVRSRACRSP